MPNAVPADSLMHLLGQWCELTPESEQPEATGGIPASGTTASQHPGTQPIMQPRSSVNSTAVPAGPAPEHLVDHHRKPATAAPPAQPKRGSGRPRRKSVTEFKVRLAASRKVCRVVQICWAACEPCTHAARTAAKEDRKAQSTRGRAGDRAEACDTGSPAATRATRLCQLGTVLLEHARPAAAR